MYPKHIGYLIKSINDKIKVKADSELKSHNLTLAQSRVLAFLNSKGGTVTQKNIEDFLEVSHPTVVGIVSRMEQNGHIFTWIDPKNRRNKMVCLTEEAHKIGEKMDCVIREQEERMLRGLTSNQITELENMLMIIYKNFN